MSDININTRWVWQRMGDYSTGAAKIQQLQEDLPASLDATSVLIKVHAVAFNYRDANIAHGSNPRPTIPHGIICNDASGEIVAKGEGVKTLSIGDRVAPNVDTRNITGREIDRSWLAADEDGVLADYVISMRSTGGVSLFALKLARCKGMKVILTSSSDDKLKKMKERFPGPPLGTVKYPKTSEWHEEVLKLTKGVGVDLAIEVAGNDSLIKSTCCTRRGGIVSLVGYLSKQNRGALTELSPALIDRRAVLRGINAGSKYNMDNLCAAISANALLLDDILDRSLDFNEADKALEYIWQGKQVGKVVIDI